MVSEEIVEGLRFSMNKGDSLMKAMMSFYNAGYSKLEVEEAARMLNQPSLQNVGFQPQTQPQQTVQAQPIQTQPAPGTPTQYVSQYGSPIGTQPPTVQVPSQLPFAQTPIPGSPQMVSNYGVKRKHPLSTGVMIFLAMVLFLLLSALVSLIVFKDVIAGFFGGFL